MAGKYRKDGTLRALFDPDAAYPGRLFSGGRWKTPEQIKAKQESNRRYFLNLGEDQREKKREAYRNWKKRNPEKYHDSKLRCYRNYVHSGKMAERRKLSRLNDIEDGKCGSCHSRPLVSGLSQCQVCKTKAYERQRLQRRFGMSVKIIRELGLDKNLPAPRRENADR